MTEADPPREPAPEEVGAVAVQGGARRRPWSTVVAWVRAKDPDLLVVKRSVRAGVLMPGVFALARALSSNPQTGLFAAFGSMAMLLMVDFPGRPRTRLISYVGLGLAGACLVVLGTIASTHAVAAVVAMAAVAFVVLFTGIAVPLVATASTAVLLAFVLSDAVAQPATAVGARLIGWALAAAFCVPACLLVWPPPWHDKLRRRLSATTAAVARLASVRAEGSLDQEAAAEVESEVSSLRAQYAGTAYSQSASLPGAVALAKLVGRIQWTAESVAQVDGVADSPGRPPIRSLMGAVARTLGLSASLICDGDAHPVDDPVLVHEIQVSTQQLDHDVDSELDAEVSALLDGAGDGDPPPADHLGDPRARSEGGAPPRAWARGFHTRASGIATELVADAVLEAAGAEPASNPRLRTSRDRSPRLVWRLLLSHLSLRSVSFRNAVRGAAGLALAVAVVEVTNVEHGFWVVLGTLSVLRSSAVGTGSTALRAVGGTAAGVVVGSAITIGLGGHFVLLWVLLPLSVLVAGVTPTMVSFAAGQAGFTVVVIILFNIIVPTGWRVGLTRIEDVAIGCGVSVIVGLLFWPRGATAALGRALSDAFVASSGFLATSVERLTTTTHEVDTAPAERAAHGAYLRLDDAFRQFLTERGAKVVPVETVGHLFTGSSRIRLAAYTMATLPVYPPRSGEAELESVAIAGAVLRDAFASNYRWYEEFGEVLADRRDTLDDPPDHDATVHDVLGEALADARARGRGDRLRTVFQILWADELLEAQRTVQADLAESVRLFAGKRHQHILT